MDIDVPIGASDYFRRSAGNPSISTRNVYFEQDPTNQATQSSLIRRPGIKKFLQVGAGPIRKVYHRLDAFRNDFFVVSGTKVFRIHRENSTLFYITPLVSDISPDGDIKMTASGSTLFLTDQTDLYQSDGTAGLAKIEIPDDAGISLVAYIGGYIICVVKNSQRFYWLNPGEITIDPLNFAEAEGLPDGIVDTVVLGDQVFFFGKETIEVWYLSGDSSAPFQRIQGRLLSIGALEDAACLIPGSDSFFFIASDGTARLGADFQKVSTSAIEERIRRAISAQHII